MATDVPFNFTAYLEQPIPWQNRPESIRGIVITVTSIAFLCVLSRLYIRLSVLRMAGWDDMFVGLYFITTLASAVSVCISPSFGLGQHLIMFTPEELRGFLILFYIGNASYVSSTAFMKLALLFQYLRVFKTDDEDNDNGDKNNSNGKVKRSRVFLRRTCQVLIVIVGLWGATFSFLAWVPCLPVSTYWDAATTAPAQLTGTCYGFGISTDRTAFIMHTAINMALDVCVLAIPVPLYLGATLTLPGGGGDGNSTKNMIRARAGVLVLLLLGGLVNVFAAWRLVLLISSNGDVIETLFDSTFYAPETVLLSSLEVNLASICASVPIFWPVLRRQVFRILVTKEVEITRGDRDSDSKDGKLVDDDDDDESGTESGGDGHYNDAFIRDQVDPLRPGTSVGVETQVRSETAKTKQGWAKPWRR